MTRKDKGHYAQKHPADRRPQSRVAEAVKERAAPRGELSCAGAFQLAATLEVPPREIGLAADLLEIRIVKCQLGLFGYQPRKKIVEPASEVPGELEEAVQSGLVGEKLPCETAWGIADTLGLKKMDVSAACETLGIKISPCQLGAF